MDIIAKHRALSRMLFIDGAYAASEGDAFAVLNPATEAEIGAFLESELRP